MIQLEFIQSIYGYYQKMSPLVEVELFDTFNNAYSFVVRGKALIIFFEGEKDKNLLVLQKREKHDLISSNLSKNGFIWITNPYTQDIRIANPNGQ